MDEQPGYDALEDFISRISPYHYKLITKMLGSPYSEDFQIPLITFVEEEPEALQWISNEYQTKELCLAAVNKEGLELEHVPEELIHDRDILKTAIRNTPFAIKFLPDDLKEDEELITLALQQPQEGSLIQFLPDNYRKNKEFIIPYIEKYGIQAYLYCDYNIKTDFDVITVAIRKNPWTYNFLMSSSRYSETHGRHFALLAVQNCGELIKKMPQYTEDIEIATIALNKDPKVIQWIGNKITSNKEIMLDVLRKDAAQFRYINEDLKSDIDILRIVIRQNPDMFRHIYPIISSNPEVILTTIAQNREVNLCVKDFNLSSVRLMRQYQDTIVLENLFASEINITDFTPRMVENMNEPLVLQDLSGDMFELTDWFTSQDLLTLVSQQHPTLANVDIMIGDMLVSETLVTTIKEYLVYDTSEEGPDAMIIYPDLE